MTRAQVGDLALVAAALVLGAASAQRISVADAGHSIAHADRVLFISRVERGAGRFGPAYLTILRSDPGLRVTRACASRVPVTGRHTEVRICALIEDRGRSPRITRVFRFIAPIL